MSFIALFELPLELMKMLLTVDEAISRVRVATGTKLTRETHGVEVGVKGQSGVVALYSEWATGTLKCAARSRIRSRSSDINLQ